MLCWPGAEQGVLNDSVDNFKKVLDTFFFFFFCLLEKSRSLELAEGVPYLLVFSW